MPIPVAVGVAVAITETAVKVAELIFKIATASNNSEEIAVLSRQVDQLTADLLRLRVEILTLGQTILLEIKHVGEALETFELNRIQSRAESALNHLQAFRVTNAKLHSDTALVESEAAVTEFANAAVFANHAAAIGGFLFVVNARLQIVAELESVLLADIAFHRQIDEWVRIVRAVADEFEREIRTANQRRVSRRETFEGEQKNCYFDIEIRKVVCDILVEGHKRIRILYSNISGSVGYAFDSDVPGSGQPFGSESEALNRGILDDLRNLGVDHMRRLAGTWESTRRSSGVVRLSRRFLGRSLTELERRAILDASEKGDLDTERFVRGVLRTPEFIGRLGIGVGKEKASTPATVKAVFEAVMEREPAPKELRIYSEVHEHLGYEAFVAALGTLVMASEDEGEEDGKKSLKRRRTASSALDVMRSL